MKLFPLRYGMNSKMDLLELPSTNKVLHRSLFYIIEELISRYFKFKKFN
jgi:hypothetical protein